MKSFTLSPDKEEALRIENEQNQKLYRQLGIEPTKQDDGVSHVVDYREGYFPPVEKYWIRSCTDHDLNR
jgi:hypothetical protein